MHAFWQQRFLGNSITAWVTGIGIIAGGILLLFFVKLILVKRLAAVAGKTKATFDDFIVKAFRKTLLRYLYCLVIYEGLVYLTRTERATSILQKALLVVTSFFILKAVTGLLQYLVRILLSKQDEGELKQKQAKGLVVLVKGIVWIMGAIFVLNNLGYNVSTIIAGLGIGGIAIALAAQTILGDLFSYFVILFDRPFEIGDFIIIDDKMGVVEYIGIKTTRLRTLGGEQLICSNKSLTEARVHNFKRMERRRVVFTISVTYQTSAELLKTIPAVVKGIISKQPDVSFDRGHFSGFGNFSLNFEFVYYILSSDYNIYMDRQQAIYYDIFKAFKNSKIQFAYPTQTLFVNGEAVTMHAN